MEAFNKYIVAGSEAEQEVLPNLLGITTVEEIEAAEFESFAKAQDIAIDSLSADTVFDLTYLYTLHKNAFGNIYSFAGKLRTVNMSKAGFSFPPSGFLPSAMQDFENDFLNPIAKLMPTLENAERIKQLAQMHAELLFVHPFREGNGRTIRLFTNMIYFFYSNRQFVFEQLADDPEYILAVQQAAQQKYALMEKLFLRIDSSL